MAFTPAYISYRNSNHFSAISVDYVEGNDLLKPFYEHPVNAGGIKDAIKQRKQFPTNRQLLFDHLLEQYSGKNTSAVLQANIDNLLDENCFTITTAHQPNIFTGHLYFIYKIIHAIKLASTLQQQLPQYKFVPLYYMGSEDADLEELGEVYINGTTYKWETNQAGAVGRMKIDKKFIELIDAIEGQLGVEPFGKEIIQKVRAAYSLDKTIEQATFEFVHELFGSMGLVILLPDAGVLKNSFAPLIKKELEEGFSASMVAETMAAFPPEYKIQAAGREINLFYLQQNSRERIEKTGNGFKAAELNFTRDALFEKLDTEPENFSPNVILRPVFQEWVLPNVAFIGGGGELAYWLELKKVFEASSVPFPVLVLRNSFLVLNKNVQQKMQAMQLSDKDIFEPADALLKRIIEKHSSIQLSLDKEKTALAELYQKISQLAGGADTTLVNHVKALQVAAEKRIDILEKKMYRAEKKRFEAQQRQLQKMRSILYPKNSLQERVENLLPWYAAYGVEFIESLLHHSLSLEQEFCILKER